MTWLWRYLVKRATWRLLLLVVGAVLAILGVQHG